MRRILYGVLLGLLSVFLVAMPVLATYYYYIYAEESAGNTYDNLAINCSANIDQLATAGFITSTGLDTRVLTGDGDALPHMLATDRIMFVSDLSAYEDKTLIFYTGATSLSSFPIIPGYGGYITTEDDADLELTYVMELLASGYFNSSAGSGKNILYKEEAYRVWISAANKLEVSGLEAGGGEAWEMTYSSFTTGEHTIYVVSDGMQAKLYVDNFVTPKDTENLYDSSNAQMTGTALLSFNPPEQASFYANGRYWCFYLADSNTIGWRSSTDGDTWAAEQTVDLDVGDTTNKVIGAYHRDGYVHLVYAYLDDVMYRRGAANADGTVTWSAVWQTAVAGSNTAAGVSIAVDVDGYPFITYTESPSADNVYISASSANDGTWVTAGGYPFAVDPWKDGRSRITAYYNNDDLYLMYIDDTAGGHTLQGNYYNGSSWGGLHTVYAGSAEQYDWHAVSDSDGNLYIAWLRLDSGGNYDYVMKIRYAGGTWSSLIEIADITGGTANWDCCLTYNPTTDGIYFFYDNPSAKAVYGYVLIGDTLIGPYTFSSASTNVLDLESPAYSDHMGITTFNANTIINHQYLTYPWGWNDNANNWTWMENNVMPYADDFQMGIDGELVLEYKPADIIESSTLPDEESDHDGIITWGANPAGVDVSISGIQSDETEDQYSYYPYIEPGSQDIIGPEPAELISDVNLDKLGHSPFSPLIETIVAGSDGHLTQSLVWLGFAFFLLIAIVIATLILSRYNILLTCIVGLAVSILFYTVMPVLPLAVVILFAFGAVASFIHERMPTW